MKALAYFRVAKQGNKPKVAVSAKPTPEPLRNAEGALPTVLFAVEFDIPDEAFGPPQLQAKVKVQHSVPLVEVKEVPFS